MPPPPSEEQPVHKEKRRAEKTPLESLLSSQELWSLPAEQISERSGGELAQGLWKGELFSDKGRGSCLSLLGRPLKETAFRFEKGKLKSVYALIDVTDDAKDVERIAAALKDLQEKLDAQTGEPGKSSQFQFANKRKLDILRWATPLARIYLRGNLDRTPAFLSVQIEKAESPELQLEKRFMTKKSVFADSEGESLSEGRRKILAVPMRHQIGDTCYPTTFARQLGLLGSELDAPTIELMSAGDSDNKLMERNGREFGFYTREYSVFDRPDTGENSLALLSAYNKLARESGKTEIKSSERNGLILYGDNFGNMEQGLLNEIPQANPEKYAAFRKIVASTVDCGLPIGWTVARWAPKVKGGGSKHRRLIVGYDLDKDLIYYSDTWGLGHEKKPMPFRAAFAMTVWMQTMAPSWIPGSSLPEALKHEQPPKQKKR